MRVSEKHSGQAIAGKVVVVLVVVVVVVAPDCTRA